MSLRSIGSFDEVPIKTIPTRTANNTLIVLAEIDSLGRPYVSAGTLVSKSASRLTEYLKSNKIPFEINDIWVMRDFNSGLFLVEKKALGIGVISYIRSRNGTVADEPVRYL